MKNRIPLLASRKFLPLFVTQFFGAFNDNAFKNAFLIWFTYDVATKTGQKPELMVTIAAGIFIIPFFLFSAIAGQIADKFERSKITHILKFTEILLIISSVICFSLQNINGLLVILFLMGAQSTFFGPIKYSLLPSHLEESELIKGNALIEGGTFLAILLGTIFGGLVILKNQGLELYSFALILFSIIGFIASKKIPIAKIADSQLKLNLNILSETFRLISYAKKQQNIWLSMFGISWFWLIGATFLTQFPIYTNKIIAGDENIVTLYLAIFSVGIATGSLLCNKLLKSKISGRLIPIGLIGISISIILLYIFSHFYLNAYDAYVEYKLSPEFFINNSDFAGLDEIMGLDEYFNFSIFSSLIALSLLILSIFSGIYIVPLYAILQNYAEREYLSRIIAANNILNSLFMVIASILIIAVYSVGLDVTQVFLIIAFSNIPLFIYIKKITKV